MRDCHGLVALSASSSHRNHGDGLIRRMHSTTPSIAALRDAWRPSGRGDLIDWVGLRYFLDHLTRHPQEISEVISRPPKPSGSALLDNILVGIGETQADDAGLTPTSWTRQVKPLKTPWKSPGTPKQQARAATRTPLALAVRGITLSRSCLWRTYEPESDDPAIT